MNTPKRQNRYCFSENNYFKWPQEWREGGKLLNINKKKKSDTGVARLYRRVPKLFCSSMGYFLIAGILIML
jgi:hypothetical protein